MAEIAKIEVETLEAEEAVQAAAADAKAKSEAAAEAGLAAGQLKTEVETLAKLLTPVGDSRHAAGARSHQGRGGLRDGAGRGAGRRPRRAGCADAPAHWRVNAAGEADPALPAGVEPLVARVEGPPELTRRLRQIGVVAAADGARLQRTLRVRPAPGLPGGPLVALGRLRCGGRGVGGGCHAPCRAQSARHACPRRGRGTPGGGERTRGRRDGGATVGGRPGRGEAVAPALARGADQGGADPRGADRHGAPGAGDGGQDCRRRRCQGPRPRRARRGARPPLGNRGGAGGARRHTSPGGGPGVRADGGCRPALTRHREPHRAHHAGARASRPHRAAGGDRPASASAGRRGPPAPISRSPRSRNGPPRPRPRSPSLRPCPP